MCDFKDVNIQNRRRKQGAGGGGPPPPPPPSRFFKFAGAKFAVKLWVVGVIPPSPSHLPTPLFRDLLSR